MPIESWVLNEEEKKKNKLTEKEKLDNIKKKNEHKKIKEKILVEIEAENKIFDLKELVEKWIISKETAKKVTSWENIDEEIINEIFKKIDEMEEIKDIDKYLPPNLRISHEEYLKALHDDIFRVQTLTKLDSALIILSRQISPNSSMWVNLFSWFLSVLDKNLITVQEHTIDVKNSLKEIDEKKFWNTDKNKKNFLQIIIDFVKDIFRN